MNCHLGELKDQTAGCTSASPGMTRRLAREPASSYWEVMAADYVSSSEFPPLSNILVAQQLYTYDIHF